LVQHHRKLDIESRIERDQSAFGGFLEVHAELAAALRIDVQGSQGIAIEGNVGPIPSDSRPENVRSVAAFRVLNSPVKPPKCPENVPAFSLVPQLSSQTAAPAT